MPIYEYICRECDYHVEIIQKISDAPLENCERCGGAVYRPISQTSFLLKGSGWYADGYASAKPSTGNGDATGGGAGCAKEGGCGCAKASDTKNASAHPSTSTPSTSSKTPSTPPGEKAAKNAGN